MALSTVLDACSEVNGPYVDVPWIASYSPIGTGGYHRFVTPLRFPCVVVVAPKYIPLQKQLSALPVYGNLLLIERHALRRRTQIYGEIFYITALP